MLFGQDPPKTRPDMARKFNQEKVIGRCCGITASEGLQEPNDRKMGRNLGQRLKNEGFLLIARGGKLTRIETSIQAAHRQRTYCNPTTWIDHCVCHSLASVVDL